MQTIQEVKSARVSFVGQALLTLENVSLAIGEKKILDGVSLTVEQGQLIGLLGRNGSGKSTLLSILTGLCSDYSGSMRFAGNILKATDKAWRSQVGVVFQTPSCDIKLTSRENLFLAGMLYGMNRKPIAARVVELLELMQLTDRADEPVGNLSGGMRRKLDIARALIPSPSILILDEPSSGLDEASFRSLWATLLALKQKNGLTILSATHRPEEADLCDKLAILSDGKILAFETPAVLRSTLNPDVLLLEGPNRQEIADIVSTEMGLKCLFDGEQVLVECKEGHLWIPKIVERLQGKLASVGLRKASMSDAFLKITGTSLDFQAFKDGGK